MRLVERRSEGGDACGIAPLTARDDAAHAAVDRSRVVASRIDQLAEAAADRAS